MTKQQAMKEAHRIAYICLEQALQIGMESAANKEWDEASRAKVEAALERLTQRHFDASLPVKR